MKVATLIAVALVLAALLASVHDYSVLASFHDYRPV